jgi:hypothetical protein
MFCPLWARNVETPDTMPGRSRIKSTRIDDRAWSALGYNCK